jgi:hypothetical protein
METAAVLAVAFAAKHRQRLRRRQLLLQAMQQSWVPAYEYIQSSFSLELMTPGRARVWLRFTAIEIRRLVPLLELDQVVWRNRLKPHLETALCVLCARLSYPGRWAGLADLFGRSQAWLSTVFNDIVIFLAGRFGPVLWWHPQLTYNRLQVFADAVEREGGAGGVWGFVDGTFRGHCRPKGQIA